MKWSLYSIRDPRRPQAPLHYSYLVHEAQMFLFLFSGRNLSPTTHALDGCFGFDVLPRTLIPSALGPTSIVSDPRKFLFKFWPLGPSTSNGYTRRKGTRNMSVKLGVNE